jgi:hypothetical protein
MEHGDSLPAHQELIEQDADLASLLHQTAGIDLYFDSPGFLRKDIEIKDVRGAVMYLGEVPLWKNVPDIILHRGSKDGPVIGTSRFTYNRNAIMTLEPPLSKGDAGAVTFSNDSSFSGHNRYSLAISSSHGYSGRTFNLIRTQSKKDGVKELKGALAFHNFKAVDRNDGMVVGLRLNALGGSYGKLHLAPSRTQGGRYNSR